MSVWVIVAAVAVGVALGAIVMWDGRRRGMWRRRHRRAMGYDPPDDGRRKVGAIDSGLRL